MNAELSKPRIVCAAIRNKRTNVVIVGPRHFDLTMCSAIPFGELDKWKDAEQGFIDQHGEFYTRQQAWPIAWSNRQIIKDRDWQPGVLHSEHLY